MTETRQTRGALFVTFTLVLMIPAAVALAHGFGAPYADTRSHTWWTAESDTADLLVFYWRMQDVTENELDAKTDLSLWEDSCHLNCYNSSTPHVDLSWWASDLPAPLGGLATCNIYVAGDTSRCDHWQVVFDNDPGQSSNSLRQKVCHELVHTVGFKDSGITLAPYGCLGGGDINNGVLDTVWHEQSHINARY